MKAITYRSFGGRANARRTTRATQKMTQVLIASDRF
jgi:transposase-like protein